MVHTVHLAEIVYPESDGQPMAGNRKQFFLAWVLCHETPSPGRTVLPEADAVLAAVG